MEKYKISVIVPVYNAEKYLDKCIESIIEQTHKNLEIIIVDDGLILFLNLEYYLNLVCKLRIFHNLSLLII